MGSIIFRCPCGQKLSAVVRLSGKKVRCPRCHEVVQVPRLVEAEGGDSSTKRASFPWLWVAIPATALLMLIWSLLVFHWSAQRPSRLAGEKVAVAKSLVSDKRYEDALTEIKAAERILSLAGIESDDPVEEIRSMRSQPPLKYVLAGLVEYQDKWVTPEEKAKLARGLVEYKGRWVAPNEKEKLEAGYVKHAGAWVTLEDKAMLQAGYVKHEGRWVTPDEKARLQAGYVQYRGEWITPEEKANLERGLVRFDGGWTTPRGRATLQCIRQTEEFDRISAMEEPESVQEVLEMIRGAVQFYYGLDLGLVDPDLKQLVREESELLAEVEQIFRELVRDRDEAQEKVDMAAIGGGIRGGLEAAAYAETPEEGLVRGALLGFLRALEASEEAKSREMGELVQKWERKLTHEFVPLGEKLEALGALEVELTDEEYERIAAVGMEVWKMFPPDEAMWGWKPK